MVPLLKIVIFHGYVSHNQGVCLNFSEIKGLLNPLALRRDRHQVLVLSDTLFFEWPVLGPSLCRSVAIGCILFGATIFWTIVFFPIFAHV
jgi:hypothetical protein